MKLMRICFTGFLLFLSVNAGANERFDAFWYDGNAEISVYDIEEARYNEIRNGKRVMIFVTEPLRRTSLIKPDTLLEPQDRYDVIKLNDVRKFTTGIYDYSLMTSVFSTVRPYEGIPSMAAVKVTFTSQEWCGHVFEMFKRKKNGLKGELYSYFESDGEPETEFKANSNVWFEDNLWIMIRELKEPLMAIGEKKEIEVIPSSWQRRKYHVAVEKQAAVIEKKSGGRIRTNLGWFKSNQFIWEYGNKKTTVWVELEWPGRILQWIEPDGSRGKLVSSSRQPYWKLRTNKDIKLRRRLRVD